jgi:hypothetical protein
MLRNLQRSVHSESSLYIPSSRSASLVQTLCLTTSPRDYDRFFIKPQRTSPRKTTIPPSSYPGIPVHVAFSSFRFIQTASFASLSSFNLQLCVLLGSSHRQGSLCLDFVPRDVVAQVEFDRHVLKPGLIFKGKGLEPRAFQLWVRGSHRPPHRVLDVHRLVLVTRGVAARVDECENANFETSFSQTLKPVFLTS